MSKFILASASQRRVTILTQIGYKPDLVVPADIDETAKKGETPRNLALRLSCEKAQKIAEQFPEDVILGADTVVGIGRLILPKGETEEDARYCLQRLSGRRHKVYTGVCMIYKQKVVRRVGVTVIKFKVLSHIEKEDFIKTGQWYGKAGAYALQGFASKFVENMSGVDTNVVGLPACIVHKVLNGAGIQSSFEVSRELQMPIL